MLHVLLWLTLFSLPLLFRPFPSRGEEGYSIGPFMSPLPFPIIMNNLFLLVAFYVNLYVLMPRFLNKKKWGWYLLFTLLFLICSLYIHEFSRFIESTFWPNSDENIRHGIKDFPLRNENMNRPNDGGESWKRTLENAPGDRSGTRFNRPKENLISRGFVFRQFSFTYMFLLTWVVSMAYYMFKLLQASVRRADQVLSTALQSELSFLKAQINPHFLFNTLNNIYVLTLKKSEQAPAAVMKLSNLMRTLTNDTGVDYVSFQEEERFIRDYLELQEMRLTEKTKVIYQVEGNFSELKIAPRILLPFIDNAFKYGVSNRYESDIIIRMIFVGNTMDCLIQNAIHRDNTENLGSSGIGVGNSTRRLELLYEDKYDLKISETDNLHRVQLKIDLS